MYTGAEDAGGCAALLSAVRNASEWALLPKNAVPLGDQVFAKGTELIFVAEVYVVVSALRTLADKSPNVSVMISINNDAAARAST